MSGTLGVAGVAVVVVAVGASIEGRERLQRSTTQYEKPRPARQRPC